jgi:AcrR family transcriptional regulator
MPKAFTDHERKLIGERLLEQGYSQFSTRGLKKTSIEELAVSAGISKAAFYIFYESKEALFMDVVEQAEKRYRQEVLSVIDMPGPSPRARLFAVLKKAFSLWRTYPILQTFTRNDYEVVYRRVPVEKIQEHLRNDQGFVDDLVSRCQKAGIPIQARSEEINGLLHALFFTVLHEDDLGPEGFGRTIDVLLELTAAFCLGEVTIQLLNQADFIS